ncbi:MAG: hypothetical protein WBD20_15075 [Pirellulaceae bacterium]
MAILALLALSTQAQEVKPKTQILADNPVETNDTNPFESTDDNKLKIKYTDENPFGEIENASKNDNPSQANVPKPAVATESAPARKFASPEESEARIRSLLSSEAELPFFDAPLSEVADYISDVFEFPVLIDRRALEEIGIDDEALVNLDVGKISLRSGLKLILRDLDLTYAIKNEVLMITTKEAADQFLVVMSYPLPSEMKDDAGVVNAITSLVRPANWSSAGGPASLFVVENSLFVSANEEIHEEVADVIKKLTAVISKPSGKKKVTAE